MADSEFSRTVMPDNRLAAIAADIVALAHVLSVFCSMHEAIVPPSPC